MSSSPNPLPPAASRMEGGPSLREGGKGARSWLPGVLVSLFCLAVILSWIHPARLVESLRLADYRLVLLAAPLSFLWLLLRAVAWRVLMSNRPTYSAVFSSLCEGYLLNNLLPFRLGEVGRAYLMGKKSRLGFWQVLPTILVERMLDLVIAVGLLLGALPFVVGVEWATQAVPGIGAVMVAGLVVLYLLARNRQRLQEWVGQFTPGLAHRLPGRLGKMVERLAQQTLPAFLAGLAILTDGRRFLLALGLILLNWAIAWLQYALLLRAFFPQSTPLWGLFTMAVSALGLAAPSVPGGVGVYELAFMSAVSVFTADASRAAAVAFLTHLISYLTGSLLGAYGLLRDGESLGNLYRQVQTGASTQPPAPPSL